MDLTEQDELQVLRVIHTLPLNFVQQLNVRGDDTVDVKDLQHTPHSEWTLLDVVRAARKPQDAPLWASYMRWRAKKDRYWKTICFIAYTLVIASYVNDNVGPGVEQLD